MKSKLLSVLLVAIIIFLSGCSSTSNNDEPIVLNLGIMPAVDAAPILLAQQEGYFEEEGIIVNIQVYTNATERQSALQSEELDGAMTDMIALVNNAENGFGLKITSVTDGVFPFLVNPDYDGSSEVNVGMMEVSVTNYMADKLLGDSYTINKVYINDISARLTMVTEGTLDMAVIPEPMASQGELNGLTKNLIENPDEYCPDVIVFTDTAISEKADAIQAFYTAYDKAVDLINTDDSTARDVLIGQLQLNPEIKDLIILPEYHHTRIPDEAYLNDIIAWNEEVLDQQITLTYSDFIDDSFVQ